MTEDTQEVSSRNGPVGEPEPPRRGGGLPLPGLKYWRVRRGLTQAELTRRAALKSSSYVFRVETGRRGCHPETARLLADLLGVGLEDLRREPADALDTKAPPESPSPRISSRQVHQAYLGIFLQAAVGSAYAAMDEWEMRERFERGTWEEALAIARARKREAEFLGEAIGARGVLENPDLPDDVRAYLEGVLGSFPDLDMHLLAAVRRREASEEGREALTKAMRELL